MSHKAPFALLLIIATAAVAGCSKSQTASPDASRIVEQTVSLIPATVPVKIGPLTGEFSGLSATRRVDESTGRVVYEPKLTGTLVLRNASEDQAVRLIGGELTYLRSDGTAIKLADGRDASFTFPSYSVDRLDPGQETRQSLDVAFPTAAFKGGLAEVHLGVKYLPMPYREETVAVDMTIGS